MGGIFARRAMRFHPPGSGAELLELSVRLGGLAVFLARERFKDAPRPAVGVCGRLPEQGGRLPTRVRGDLPRLREGDLLLERVSGGAAVRTLVRHRLRLGGVAADVAFDLRDDVHRIDARYDGRVLRGPAGDGFELRELRLLPPAELLEGDLHPHLSDRDVREVIERHALDEGADRPRDGLRRLPVRRGQGDRPPQQPEVAGYGRENIKIWDLYGRRFGGGSDAPAELLLRRLGHHLGRPRRVPDDVDLRLFDPRQLLELPLDVLVDVRGRGAARRGERHFHADLAVGRVQVDVVDEVRVVALPEDADHIVLRRHVRASPFPTGPVRY